MHNLTNKKLFELNKSNRKKVILFSLFFVFNTVISTSAVFGQDFNSEETTHNKIDSKLQKNFIVVESVRPHDLNPHTTSYSSDSQILSGLYEGLFSYNPTTLEPEYAIATSFKISRDKLRWTFTLRENALFSNGEQITAKSVRDSWIQLLSTENAPYASLLDIIKNAEKFRNNECSPDAVGIYVIDDSTLSVHLEKPANYLPKVLCHSAFSVIHRNPTVYSGPFMLNDQEQYILELAKNPFYWDADNTHLEKITFVQSNDLEENTFMYNTGAIDWITSGNVNSTNILNKNSIQMNAEFGISYLFMKNDNGKPQNQYGVTKFNPWDKIEFRQALLEATPWDKLRQNIIVPASTFVFPLTGYPEVEGLSYTDLIEAKQLITAAKNKYDIPEDEILPLTFEIAENSFTDQFLTDLHDAYALIGIDLHVIEIPNIYYLSNIPNSVSDMFSYVWIGDFADPLAFLELFRGKSTLNVTGWKNTQYDDLLDKAAIANTSERYALLAQAEEILLDSGMIYPIYHPVSFNIINTEAVGGWSANAFDIHPLKYLYKKAVSNKIPNVVLYNQN